MDVELVVVHPGDAVPTAAPLAVVLGSGVDSSLVRVREALVPFEPALADWAGAGAHIIGVGTGFELLGSTIDIDGEEIAGLGLLPGRATALAERAAGEIMVDTDLGTLVGYENHARGFAPASDASTPVAPLGRVRVGSGNGNGFEGARNGTVIGTHLHGPFLARNPRVADELLGLGAADVDAEMERADLMASAIAAAAVKRAGAGRG
jgi:CobQ-like glutamine amidotransferase family enzyme